MPPSRADAYLRSISDALLEEGESLHRYQPYLARQRQHIASEQSQQPAPTPSTNRRMKAKRSEEKKRWEFKWR